MDTRDDLNGLAHRCIGEAMIPFWEEEVRRLGGVPGDMLKRDGIDAA